MMGRENGSNSRCIHISLKPSRYSSVVSRPRDACYVKHFVCCIREQAWGAILSKTRVNLRNSLIRIPFSRVRRRAYRAGEGLNRFVTDPLISRMRGSSRREKDERIRFR